MLIDAHTHVNFEDFGTETAQVVQRAMDANVWIINAGADMKTSQSAVELTKQYEEGVYAAVGMHPEHAYDHTVMESGEQVYKEAEEFVYEAFKELASDAKVVAIGECGLDYYFIREGEDKLLVKAEQRAVFEQQIKLAIELDKALMIHCRPTSGSMDAYQELVGILSEVKEQTPQLRFQIHCYTGNLECAQKFVELGGYISLSGIITFDKTGNSREVATHIPLDRLLVETDAPYLAPAPFRGKRNEPAYVEHIAKKIAEWRNISLGEVAEQTTTNAKALFKI